MVFAQKMLGIILVLRKTLGKFLWGIMKYIPIDCDFYDLLEISSMRGQISLIEYQNGSTLERIQGKIIDLFINAEVEYLRLDSGLEIRLDSLVRFDGVLNPRS